MVLTHSDEQNARRNLKGASLDRIDSNKGYVEGNVQLICMMLNLGKSDSEHDEFKDVLKEIAGGINPDRGVTSHILCPIS